MAYSILIAEDDSSIAELLRMALTASGYQCNRVSDGNAARQSIEQESYHLALLDIMLPKLDGYQLWEVCKRKDIPFIFVTAKTSVLDRVDGLSMGAEDYITKTFDLLEVLTRVEVALRRRDHDPSDTLSVEDVTIDCNSRQVFKAGELMALKPKEYELLEFLLQN